MDVPTVMTLFRLTRNTNDAEAPAARSIPSMRNTGLVDTSVPPPGTEPGLAKVVFAGMVSVSTMSVAFMSPVLVNTIS